MTIPEISKAEGLSVPNVAKLMRLLRIGEFVKSSRGQSGGYTLARPADKIRVAEVMELLGGPFFSNTFCQRHAGTEKKCTHSSDCPLRTLWTSVQTVLSAVLGNTTLADLTCAEREMSQRIRDLTGALMPLCQKEVAAQRARARA